jgi:hypothetical protein
MECLLSFGAEYFVSHFAVHKYKDINSYNVACCCVWVWNLDSHTEGEMQVQGVR